MGRLRAVCFRRPPEECGRLGRRPKHAERSAGASRGACRGLGLGKRLVEAGAGARREGTPRSGEAAPDVTISGQAGQPGGEVATLARCLGVRRPSKFGSGLLLQTRSHAFSRFLVVVLVARKARVLAALRPAQAVTVASRRATVWLEVRGFAVRVGSPLPAGRGRPR
jgi:hypothetical protein